MMMNGTYEHETYAMHRHTFRCDKVSIKTGIYTRHEFRSSIIPLIYLEPLPGKERFLYIGCFRPGRSI